MRKYTIPESRLIMFFHAALGLLMIPLFQNLGELLKVATAPYIFFLVWKEKKEFVPALIVNTATGSTVAILVILICVLKILSRYNRLAQVGLKPMLWLLLLPLPVMLGKFGFDLLSGNKSFLEGITYMSYYLGLFPFFYGALFVGKFTDREFKDVFTLLLVIFIFVILGWFGPSKIRLATFAFSIFLLIGFLWVSRQKIIYRIPSYWIVAALIMFVAPFAGLFELKFNTLFAVFFSFFITLLTKYNLLNSFKRALLGPLLFFILGFLVYYAMENVERFGRVDNYSSLSHTDITTYPDFIMYKAFGDRGALWKGAWREVVTNRGWLPPAKVEAYSFETAFGEKIKGVEFGAHNIAIELLRYYGYFVGGICLLVYVLALILLAKFFNYKQKNPYKITLAAMTLGIGVVSGMTGQYVLKLNFSFFLMFFAGFFATQAIAFKSNKRKSRLMKGPKQVLEV